MKQVSEAAERNKRYIFEAIAPHLGHEARVLEIASGTGQHAAFFCENRPDLVWQPTDIDPVSLESIKSYRSELGLNAMREPIEFDIRDDLPMAIAAPYDAIININMIHISGWDACINLLNRSTRLLRKGGVLCFYGPFFRHDEEPAPSNVAFDLSLRSRDAGWGIRFLEVVTAECEKRDFHRVSVTAMPANNLTVIFQKN